MESIQVKNYRSILNSGKIKLCPLTVFLGKNSSGKSSLIRLLPLLKQSIEKKSSDTLLWYGDYVDFGDFKNTVINHDVEKSIVISFSFLVNRSRIYFQDRNIDKQLVNVELSVKEKYIKKILISFYDQSIVFNINKRGGVKISINGDKKIFEKNKLKIKKFSNNIIPIITEEIKKEKGQFQFKSEVIDVSKAEDYCKKQINQKK